MPNDKLTVQKGAVSHSLIPSPVPLGRLVCWLKHAWGVLTDHWVLVYPLLLFALIQDIMAPSILSSLQAADNRLFLLLGVQGLVWVVFSTGLLGMMFTALDAQQQVDVEAQRAKIWAQEPVATHPSPTRVLKLWGGFLDAIGQHMIAMVWGWLVIGIGVGVIAYATHWVVLHNGGYPNFVQQAWSYLQAVPVSPDALSELQDDFYNHLQALTPEQMMALDRLTWQWLGGLFAVGVWLLATLFWAPAVVRGQLSVFSAIHFSLKQFGMGLFVWLLAGIVAYIALMCIQFIGLLHPILMLFHWIALMVIQAWLLLTVCVVVDQAVPKELSCLSSSTSVDITA